MLLVGGTKGEWVWPSAVPERLCARVQATLASFPTPVPRIQVLQVDSAAHATPLVRGAAEMSANGVWVVEDDFSEVGGIEGLGIVPRATVFGIPIADEARAIYHTVAPYLPRATVAPLAVYHGTDASAVPHIQKEGLQPSHGMLGEAVSVGTFWKATRYASRTHRYAWRQQGVLVRAYLDPGRTRVLDGTGKACPCADCGAVRARAAAYAQLRGLPPTYDAERTRVADHGGTWKADHDTAHVGVVVCSGGGVNSAGTPMYANKNAEWAVARPAERLELQSMAVLDMASMARPDWDPTQRDQRIV